MLAFGYAGETGVLEAWIGLIFGMGGWFYILKEIYDYMEVCVAKEGQEFTVVIAHHSFLIPWSVAMWLSAANEGKAKFRSTESCMAQP